MEPKVIHLLGPCEGKKRTYRRGKIEIKYKGREIKRKIFGDNFEIKISANIEKKNQTTCF